MIEPNPHQRETLFVELDLHKVEFTALREEILSLIDSERQTLNLTLVATGAGITLMPYIMTQDAFAVLLLFPFVFHVLLWEMLNSIKSLGQISSYLKMYTEQKAARLGGFILHPKAFRPFWI